MNFPMKIAFLTTLTLITLIYMAEPVESQMYIYAKLSYLLFAKPKIISLSETDKLAMLNCYYHFEENSTTVPLEYQQICKYLRHDIDDAEVKNLDRYILLKVYFSNVKKQALEDVDFVNSCFNRTLESSRCANYTMERTCWDVTCGRTDVPNDFREQAKFKQVKDLRFILLCRNNFNNLINSDDSDNTFTEEECLEFKAEALSPKYVDVEKRTLNIDKAMLILRANEYDNHPFRAMYMSTLQGREYQKWKKSQEEASTTVSPLSNQ